MKKTYLLTAVLLTGICLFLPGRATSGNATSGPAASGYTTPADSDPRIDLSGASIYNTVTDRQALRRTLEILREEVEERSGIRLPVVKRLREAAGPCIILALEEDLSKVPEALREPLAGMPAPGKEGFRLYVSEKEQAVVIAGKDARGLLYGVGRFLRKAGISAGKLLLPESAAISSSPRYSMRGHQLGYRPKTNSYDAFTVEQFDQYIRDLALFGANTIEIMPPSTDDEFENRHMKLPAARMIVEQSRICDEYGLDVSMWYPNMGEDYQHPDSIRKELEERAKVFASLPRLDAVFVPAGDPGDLEPDVLFAWLKQMAVVLEKYHPHAKIWLSPQAFKPTPVWFDTFFGHVNQDYPWFGGVVFGPWVKLPLQEIRRRVKPSIPIRRYPDITHNFSCQYPVPAWDPAWAMTLGRESITPRPFEQKAIHNALDEYAIGSVSYSEGTNDDVNKFIWSAQDWDPETSVMETLRDYARLFIGSAWTEAVARGLAGLEENMKGPALTNSGVGRTLQQWQYLESKVPEHTLQNPRFQMGLIRAYFDAYVQRRLIYETELEQEARQLLLQPETGNRENGNTEAAIREAKAVLERARRQPVAQDWKQKCLDLADSLYKSIGAQLTVARHGGREGRGNFIDHIDMPLNDSPWLLARLEEIARLSSEGERKEQLRQLLHRTDPGPGGFYDHFGDPASWYRILPGVSPEEDPGTLRSPRESFSIRVSGASEREAAPMAWLKQAGALYDLPLKIRYDHLDPEAAYRIRIAYTGRFRSHVRLNADGEAVHDYLLTGQQPVYEFDVPQTATADGETIFTWTCMEGERGLQVAEVWLIREQN